MSALQLLEPAEVITRRIALEERHAEVSELETTLRGALEITSGHYIELVEEAASSGYPAPIFTVGDDEYAVHALTLNHKGDSWHWQRYKQTRVLACLRPLPADGRTRRDWRTLHILAPEVDLFHAYCHCDGEYFIKNIMKGSLHASPLQLADRRLLCAFSAQATKLLDDIASSSDEHLAAAREGLEAVEDTHLCLSA